MDGDIFAGMAKKVTKKWAKQQKAEVRTSRARHNRRDAMVRSCRITVKDAAWAYMERAYMKASANNALPAAARQIMYAARGYIQEQTGKNLKDNYFTQTLLPDYMMEHPSKTSGWDVVFDARGNFMEPHTHTKVPLGTLAVRKYLNGVHGHVGELDEELPFVAGRSFPTIGPENRFSAILFIEKEGFLPLLQKARISERYDIAIMSTKGMSVTAARRLIDDLNITVLVVRDFDKAGFSIAATLQNDTRRYSFCNSVNVIDLGLRLEDAEKWGLESETVSYGKSNPAWNLRENGATDEEIAFLCSQSNYYSHSGRRIELNAFASDQFVEWLEEKLEENGIEKVIPDAEVLEASYRSNYKRRKLQKIINKYAKKLEKKAKKLEIPDDLEEQIKDVIEKNPALPWDRAIHRTSLKKKAPK